MAKSAAEVTSKWATRTKGAVNEVKAGVERVTVAPGQQAAAASDVWQAKLMQPETREKYEANVASVSLGDWKASMINKGLGRIAAGVDGAAPKMQQFMAEFLPYVENVAAQVRQMPKLTLEDSVNRAAAQIRGNAQFRRTRR